MLLSEMPLYINIYEMNLYFLYFHHLKSGQSAVAEVECYFWRFNGWENKETWYEAGAVVDW